MTDETTKPPAGKDKDQPERQRPTVPVIVLRDLLAGGREAIIVHAGESYRLRVTANDKLILTK